MNQIRQPEPGLYVAGQPTPEQLAALARDGVKTVINLRAPSESTEFDETREAERLGLHYVSIPVSGQQDLTSALVRRFSEELEQARSKGPVLVHCGTANRVGALLALDQGLIHQSPPDTALAFGREAGLTGLEPVVKSMLSARSDS